MTTPVLLLCAPLPADAYWLDYAPIFIAGIGDSWQGTGHEGGIPTGQPLYWMQQAMAGLLFSRNSNSGVTFDYLRATQMPLALVSRSKIIIAIAGGNDIFSGLTIADMLTDLDGIKAQLRPEQLLFISEIGPGGYSTPHLDLIDQWNNIDLPAWCASNGATVLAIHTELMDPDRTLKAIYDLDGKHLTTAGVQKVAELWKAGLDAYAWPDLIMPKPTVLANRVDTSGGTTTVTLTHSPSANSLLVAFAASGNTTGTILPISIADAYSGGSLTWTKRGERATTISPVGGWGWAVFTAQTGATPGSGTVTATYSATMIRDILIVLEIHYGFKASAPIVQVKQGSSQATTLEITLDSAPADRSMVLAGVMVRGGQVGDVAPGSGFLELVENTIGVGATSQTVEIMYDLAGADSTADWSALQTSDNLGFVLEIAVAE